jgi:hypothetical protein
MTHAALATPVFAQTAASLATAAVFCSMHAKHIDPRFDADVDPNNFSITGQPAAVSYFQSCMRQNGWDLGDPALTRHLPCPGQP